MNENQNQSVLLSYDKRRLLATVKEFSLLLDQIVSALDFMIESYRLYGGMYIFMEHAYAFHNNIIY